MATEVLRLVFGDDASAGLNAARGRVDAARAAADRLRRAASAAVGALGAAVLQVGRDTDLARAEIATATGASGQALAKLTGDYRRALGQVTASSQAVAKATGDWNTHLGLTGTALSDVTAHALKAGIQGDEVAKSFRGAGLGAAEARQAIDLLTVLSERYGASADRIAAGVGRYKDRLDALGLSYAEQVTLVAKAESEGRRASQVIQALEKGYGGLREQIAKAVPAQKDYEGAAERSYRASQTLTDRLDGLRNRLASMVTLSPEVAQGVGGVAAGLGGLGTLAPQVGSAVRLMWRAVTGPVGLVVAALGAVGVAVWRFRGEIADAAASVVGLLTERIDGMLGRLEGLARRFAPGLADRVSEWRSALSDAGDDAEEWLGRYADDVEEAKRKADDATAAVADFLAKGSDEPTPGGAPALAFQAVKAASKDMVEHPDDGVEAQTMKTWSILTNKPVSRQRLGLIQAAGWFKGEIQGVRQFTDLRMGEIVAGVKSTIPPGFKLAAQAAGTSWTAGLSEKVTPSRIGGLIGGALAGSRLTGDGSGWLSVARTVAGDIGGTIIDNLSGTLTTLLPGPFGAALGGVISGLAPVVIPIVKALASKLVDAFLSVWRGIRGFFSWLGGLFGLGGREDGGNPDAPARDPAGPGPGAPGSGTPVPGPGAPGQPGGVTVEIGGRVVAEAAAEGAPDNRRFFGED